METEILDNYYKIKTAVFEGPLGVLLNLVEKRKLFINDLSLAEVTEDYLKHIKNLNATSSVEISSFIVVAATLILIKSKSLLPNLDLTLQEEGDIHDLEERLRLYEIFTKLAGNVKNGFGKKIIFAPLERKNEFLIFLPDDKITKENMMTFARYAIGAIPQKIILPKAEVKKVISIEEMINKLTDRIKKTLQFNFKEFAGKPTTQEEKVFAIVGFLAILELVRQGIFNAIQEDNSADIIIEKQKISE